MRTNFHLHLQPQKQNDLIHTVRKVADLSEKKFLYENYHCETSKKAIIEQKKSNLHIISIQIEKFNCKTVLPKERLSRNVRPAKKLSMLTRCHISA